MLNPSQKMCVCVCVCCLEWWVCDVCGWLYVFTSNDKPVTIAKRLCVFALHMWFQSRSLLGAYPRQDVAAQMSLRNWCLSSATLLAAAIVPNVSVMSFSHLCLGFPRLLFPATIPCIIVFSKPSWRVTWPKVFNKLNWYYNITILLWAIWFWP